MQRDKVGNLVSLSKTCQNRKTNKENIEQPRCGNDNTAINTRSATSEDIHKSAISQRRPIIIDILSHCKFGRHERGPPRKGKPVARVVVSSVKAMRHTRRVVTHPNARRSAPPSKEALDSFEASRVGSGRVAFSETRKRPRGDRPTHVDDDTQQRWCHYTIDVAVTAVRNRAANRRVF